MNPLLKSAGSHLASFLRTRTGFLGLGPTYGEIAVDTALDMVMRRFEEKSVVRGAEQMLKQIDERNRSF
jgi:hypothetical protein